MKRWTFVLLCAMVLQLFQLPAWAAEVVQTVSIDSKDDTLRVEGKIDTEASWLIEEKDKSDPDKLLGEFPPKVTLVVLYPGKTIEDLKTAPISELPDIINTYDVTETDSSGEFSFSNVISGPTGTYTAIISSAFLREPEITTFEFTDQFITRLNIIKSNGNAADFKSYFEKNIYSLGVQMDSYISLKRSGKEDTVMEALMAEPDYASKEQLKTVFEEICVTKAFSLLDNPDELYQVILGNFGDNAMLKQIDEFLRTTAPEGTKTRVMNRFLHQDFEGVEAFAVKLRDAVLLDYVQGVGYYKKIEDVLNTEPFGFSADYLGKYEKSVSNKETALQKFFENTRSVKDVSGIYETFYKVIDERIKNEDNNKPGKTVSSSTNKSTITLPVEVSPTPKPQATAAPTASRFTDVADDHWAAESIQALQDRGIITGLTETEFAPEQSVTKEQLVQMCMKALRFSGAGQTAEFADVNETDWFYSAVAAAGAHNIVFGDGENRFGAGREVSRQDAAVILYRCAGAVGAELPMVGGTTFIDDNEIADYAKDGVDALSSAKIIVGMPDGSFQPKKTITRAECAEIVYRFLRMLSQDRQNTQNPVWTADGSGTAAELPPAISQQESDRMDILKKLGVIEESAGIDGTMTRAEFIKSVMVLRGFEKSETVEEPIPFNDVLNDHSSAGAIVYAVKLGILDVGDGNFKPEEAADLEFATETLLNAMGYKDMARAKGSYRSLSSYSKLVSGITPSVGGALTKTQAYTLLYRALSVEILESTAYSISDTQYESAGESMMNKYMEVYHVKGRLNANHFVSISGNAPSEANEVLIDDVEYKAGLTDAVMMVGHAVDAYYRRTEDEPDIRELLVVHEDGDKDLKIYADDIIQYNNNSFSYKKENGRSATASFSQNAFIIYNGKQLSGREYSEELFHPEMGYVELLDYGNGYDVVSIVSNYDCVVDSVITNDELYGFLDKYEDNRRLVFEYDDDEVFVSLKDTAGQSVSPDTIKKGDVLTVTKSIDGSWISAVVCTDTKSGILTELLEEGMNFQDEYYEYSERLKKTLQTHDPFDLGASYLIRLNAYGKAAAVEANEKTVKYVYLASMMRDEVDEILKFKVFNDDETFSTVEFTNIRIDGKKYTSGEMNQAAEIFMTDGVFQPQLVSLIYDAGGEIKEIDTANKGNGESDGSMRRIEPTAERRKIGLTENGWGGYRYQSVVPSFDGDVYLKSGAKVFLIPKGRFAEERDYRMKNLNYFRNSYRYDMMAYSSDPNGREADVVVCRYFPKYSSDPSDRDPMAPTGPAKPFESNGDLLTGFVEKVTTAPDEYGDIRLKVDLVRLNDYTKSSFFFRWEELGENLETGTVVRYFVGPTGEISFLEQLFNCNTKGPMDNGTLVNDNGEWSIYTHKMRVNSRNIVCSHNDYMPSAFYATWRLTYFDAVCVKNGYLTLSMQDLQESPTPDPSLTSDYRLDSFKTVYRYDSNTKKLSQASAAEIIGYDMDSESYSRLLVLSSGMVSISAAIILD